MYRFCSKFDVKDKGQSLAIAFVERESEKIVLVGIWVL